MITQQTAASLPGQLRLVLRWLPLPAAVVYVAILNWHRGPQGMLVWTVGLLAFGLGLVLLARSWAKRQALLRLREPTPEPAIEWLRRTLMRAHLPHAEHTIASVTAGMRAMYGQYARALDDLDEHSWSTLPGAYQASALHVRALVHYLSRDNPSAGIALAQQAEAHSRADNVTPGASTRLMLSAMYVEIGRVLSGEVRPGAGVELSRLVAKLNAPSDRLVMLWAAALAHQATGQSTQANQIVAQLRALAPHCTPLHDIRLDAPAQPPTASVDRLPLTAADNALGNCAAHPEQSASARCVRCGDFSCRACTHALSEQASICASCHTLLGDLRRRYASHEARIRAAGALSQIAAVFWGAIAIVSLVRHEQPWLYKIAGAITPVLMGYVFWTIGRGLRSMKLGLRPRLTGMAIMLLLLPPLGTALGGYYLWLLYGPVHEQMLQPDYARALLARPDLNPRSPWRLASSILALLFANFVALIVMLTVVLR